MRKGKKLAFLLALMLGATMVFAACDDGNNPSEGPQKGNQTPAQQEEAANNAMYKERIDKWMQYVEHESKEEVNAEFKKATEREKLDSTFTGPNVLGTVKMDESEEGVEKKTCEIYSKTTMEKMLTLVSYDYADVTRTAEDVRYEEQVHYSDYIRIDKHTWSLREAIEGETEVDATDETNYVEKVTYTFYDVDGNVIASDLEEAETVRGKYVDIGDKTYLFADKEIVKVFDKGMEYALPVFDKENVQLVPGYYSDYVYFEQGEYDYRIDEAEYYSMKVGDIAMAIFPSLSVQVYKEHELVVSYETDCYNVSGYGVLSNGNVYICEYKELNDATTTYDAEIGDKKFDIVHTLINVTTGTVSTLDNAFTASRVFTNATQDIATSMNINTTMLATAPSGFASPDSALEFMLDPNNHMQGIKVKDGYVLAEIQKFENGALTGNTVYAVLDANTLAIVDELPKIVDSQFGYAGFVADEEMLFAVKTPDNKVVRYTANVETGDLNLFKKKSNDISYLDGGFMLNGVVYDYDWNVIADLSDDTFYHDVTVLPNGKLLYTVSTEIYDEVNGWYTSAWSTRLAWIERAPANDYYPEYGYQDPDYITGSESEYVLHFEEVTVTSSKPIVYGGYMTIQDDDCKVYYNLDGEKLFEMEDSVKTERTEETDEPWKFVEYEIETKWHIYDGGDYKIIYTTEDWSEISRSGYAYDEQPTEYKGGDVYYQYFILK